MTEKDQNSLSHQVDLDRSYNQYADDFAKIMQELQQINFQIEKLKDRADLQDKKIDSIEAESKENINEVKEELKSQNDQFIADLNKITKSEQDYKEAMNNQFKQILFAIVSTIITFFINNIIK